MVNKTLLGGIVGFILGGLVVSTAAVTLDSDQQKNSGTQSSTIEHSQSAARKLESLEGDAFDEAFIKEMISHHKGAIDTANLIETNAKHEELKTLGNNIIAAQSQEIDMMQAWQREWGYNGLPEDRNMHHMR